MRAMIETKNGRMRSMIHDGSQILNRSIAKLLFGLTAFLVLHTDMVAAQEAVTVQEILADPALFTRQLDEAMLAGRIDLAVHSLKDLSTGLPAGITLAAVSAPNVTSGIDPS